METTSTQTNTPQANANLTPQPSGTPVSGNAETQTSGALKEAAAEAKRRLKIDDQEVDEDEVIKIYKERKGHQRVANKELQEGRAAKKQAEEFISMMKDKQKLFDALKKLGHDPRQLSEEYLASILEEEMLDPREKELREAKNKLKSYEDLEKKQKEAAEKKMLDAMKAKFSEDYNKQFVEAVKSTGLPPTKQIVAEMAKYISRSAKIGFEMTAAEAAKLVKEDIENAHRNLYGESDAETLVRLLGEQGLQKIRAYDTSRLKDPAANLKTPSEQGEVNVRQRNAASRMTPQQWREFNRK